MLLIHIYLGTIQILNHRVMRHPVLSLDSPPLSSQCVRLAEAAASKARESARVSECAFSARHSEKRCSSLCRPAGGKATEADKFMDL